MAPWEGHPQRRAFLTVLCALVIAACGSPAVATPTPILTTAQARTAVQNYDRVDAQASAQCSATLNDTVEGGDLAAIDNLGDFNPAACTVRGTPAAPSPSATPAPTPDNQLVVPRVMSYPAFFLHYANADLGHGAGSQPNIWVMAANKKGAPWKALYQVELSAGPLLTFSRDAQGYAPMPLASSATGYRLTPAATCAAAADYVDAIYGGTPAPSNLNDPSKITQFVTTYRTNDLQMRTQNGVQSSRAWACAGTEVAEPTKAGDALVVFTLRGAYTFTPTAGETMWLDRTYADGKTVHLVPPGNYKVATATEFIILAALVPKSRSSATPSLIGSYLGVVSTTDIPA